MLDNILKAIAEKADQEIEKILQEKEEVLLRLRQEHQKAVQEKKIKAEQNLEKEANREIEEKRKAKELETSFKLQQKRNEILSSVYREAEAKVRNIAEKDFERLTKKLLKAVPKREGRLMAGERTFQALKRMFPQSKAERGLKQEGLLFQSEELEVDATISQAFNQMREKIDPELVKILFG